jgi:hypothetical protein
VGNIRIDLSKIGWKGHLAQEWNHGRLL